MTEKILFVDDDINLVSALQRSFHKIYRVELALQAEDALAALAETPYAVVVSDLHMPGMNGIELLSRVKDLSPETVRILLTGQAELEAAIEAVNEGNVFRFLRKPCPQELLRKTLDAGLTQYRLQVAERDVLQQTLVGTVAVLTELLATMEPAAFGRAARLRWCVRKLSIELKVRDPWQFEAAAMLSQIGCIPMSGETMSRHMVEEPRTSAETGGKASHARIARRILERVPRLHTVAQMIERQGESFDGPGNQVPEEYVVALGAQMLRVAIDFDEAVNRGRTFAEALAELHRNTGEYNPEVLLALKNVVRETAQAESDAGAVSSGLLADLRDPRRQVSEGALS